MKITKNPYNCFSKYVLRTPLFSFDFYQRLTENSNISNKTFKEVFSRPLVKEACFLASPTLYFEIKKWLKGELDDTKEKKIRFSLLKYLTRMSTRCTPFGLFAGCALGHFSDSNSIMGIRPESNGRHTRLDMNYLVALSQDLAKDKEIKNQLLYFPNSSIYPMGNALRFVEYYYEKSKRQHHTIEIDNSDYIQRVLQKAKSGAYLHELISTLQKVKVSKKDAESFVDELLESQVLISELEPSVSGPEFMNQIQSILKSLRRTEKEIGFLSDVEKQLDSIDKRLGNKMKIYLELSRYISHFNTPFELKYLFQTDMELKVKENRLDSNIATSVKKGMLFLNRLTPHHGENNLSKFKDAFFERYEEREVPLSKVLDVETGIGYLQDIYAGDINPLVDGLVLPVKEEPNQERRVNQNAILDILEKKLVSCERMGSEKITLCDNDFEGFPVNWEDMPDTLSAMVEIIEELEQEKIVFSGIGGSSAANLLGRFCHGNNQIETYTQTIVDFEKQMNPDKVLAEIIHLPEARVGNILMRPSFRDYEIPYLAKSNLDSEYQLPIEDLLLSIRDNRICLRSKKLDKEIIPHLTNAHNFSYNALPIYQFLCDMQIQNLRGGLYFDFGHLGDNRSFLPRVEYKNLILHKARWKLQKEDIAELLVEIDNVKRLQKEIIKWKKRFGIPDYALLVDGDNELLINFKNMTSVQMFLHTVMHRTAFTLSEFLFMDKGIVKSNNGHFTNQIIISFFNKEKLQFQNQKS